MIYFIHFTCILKILFHLPKQNFMASQSAGILLYRIKEEGVEVLLVHPGGPFWKNKDLGVWSIPKGEFTNEEDALTAAKREFTEETGIVLSGNFIQLPPVKQKAGKVIYAWVIEGDIDPASISSNLFSMEWPPKSGKLQQFPEVDRGEWFGLVQAKQKINPGQVSLLEELQNTLSSDR